MLEAHMPVCFQHSLERELKPHLVVIMADQLRFDVLGKGYTPAIDSLRSESVIFEHAYCSSPLCVPSRGSFYTGMVPNRSGSKINPWEQRDAARGDVKKGIDSLYTLMEEEWESIHSGKQHLYTEGGKLEDRIDSKTRFYSTEQTYKTFLAETGVSAPGGARFRTRVPELVSGEFTKVSMYSNAESGRYEGGEFFYFDHYFMRKALEGLAERTGDKPLLLNTTFVAPHPPFEIPEPYYSKVDKNEVQLPENVRTYYPYQSPLQMYNLTGVIGTRYDREHWRETWRVYLGPVSLLDAMVARILDELKEQGLYDDALIIFTSDHGEMLGSHALFQKMCMYEESVRIPLSFKFPSHENITPRTVLDEVSNIDVLPTLCDYLGLAARQSFDGRSLLSAIRGGTPDSRAVFIQYDGNGSYSNFQRCVVKDRYKLIVDCFGAENYYELYNVGSDPQEMNNLIFTAAEDDRVEELFSLLNEHMKRTGDELSLQPLNLEQFRANYASIPAK